VNNSTTTSTSSLMAVIIGSSASRLLVDLTTVNAPCLVISMSEYGAPLVPSKFRVMSVPSLSLISALCAFFGSTVLAH